MSFGYLKWKQRYSHSSPQKHFCKLLASYQRQSKKISRSSHGKNIKFYGLSQINKQIILRLCKLLFNDLSDYQRLHRACLAKEQKLINRNIVCELCLINSLHTSEIGVKQEIFIV